MNKLDKDSKQVCMCLCCRFCLPPSERPTDTLMCCNDSECHFEECLSRFSERKDYKVGDRVMRFDELGEKQDYEFVKPHPAGAWNEKEVKRI